MIKVEILTSPGCAGCAEAEAMMENVRPDFPGMTVEVVDILKHPEAVQKYFLMTAPGIAINGRLEFTGVPSEEELRKKLKAAS